MRDVDRYELARDLRKRYAAASRAERQAILDAFCMATGYHRTYASAVLRGAQERVAVRRRVPRRRMYVPDPTSPQNQNLSTPSPRTPHPIPATTNRFLGDGTISGKDSLVIDYGYS